MNNAHRMASSLPAWMLSFAHGSLECHQLVNNECLNAWPPYGVVIWMNSQHGCQNTNDNICFTIVTECSAYQHQAMVPSHECRVRLSPVSSAWRHQWGLWSPTMGNNNLGRHHVNGHTRSTGWSTSSPNELATGNPVLAASMENAAAAAAWLSCHTMFQWVAGRPVKGLGCHVMARWHTNFSYRALKPGWCIFRMWGRMVIGEAGLTGRNGTGECLGANGPTVVRVRAGQGCLRPSIPVNGRSNVARRVRNRNVNSRSNWEQE